MDRTDIKRFSASELYDRGIRATERIGVDFPMAFFYERISNTEVPGYSDISKWHALRAYQDEQRKKGVPIKIRSYEEADAWRDRHRKGYANTSPLPFFFGSYADNPDLQEYSDDLPYIKVYGSHGQDIAFFRNFRWREGYPKGGSNE